MENMNRDMGRAMEQWAGEMDNFRLPDWEAIPQLELYMDQVIILLTQYLGPLARGCGEKGITASSINNYVRLKIMPPPVKKKYGRVHLACLIMLFSMKQSLSMAAISRILPADFSAETTKAVYESFVQQFHALTDIFVKDLRSGANALLLGSGESPLTAAAIISNLAKDITEQLLAEPKNT